MSWKKNHTIYPSKFSEVKWINVVNIAKVGKTATCILHTSQHTDAGIVSIVHKTGNANASFNIIKELIYIRWLSKVILHMYVI